jgi:hypothetical protein
VVPNIEKLCPKIPPTKTPVAVCAHNRQPRQSAQLQVRVDKMQLRWFIFVLATLIAASQGARLIALENVFGANRNDTTIFIKEINPTTGETTPIGVRFC